MRRAGGPEAEAPPPRSQCRRSTTARLRQFQAEGSQRVHVGPEFELSSDRVSNCRGRSLSGRVGRGDQMDRANFVELRSERPALQELQYHSRVQAPGSPVLWHSLGFVPASEPQLRQPDHRADSPLRRQPSEQRPADLPAAL